MKLGNCPNGLIAFIVFFAAFVRYGWGDFVPGNLSNAEALGLVPFCLPIER